MTNPKEESSITRKRILFVDDERNVLDGLRNVLRPQRHEWEMVFALGPEQALALIDLIDNQSFDVVVSDMRMPKMEGAALLAEVKRRQPQAVRMILTGQTEQEAVMKSVFVAHMFLTKPCDHTVLKKVVARACNLNIILNSEELRAAAGRVDMLPSVPRTYVALIEALSRPTCSIADLIRIIEREPGLCAKILQLVNSAFFGLPRKIGFLTEAITYIGTQTIKALALALETFSTAKGCSLSPDQLLSLQKHSVFVGQIARQITRQDRIKAEEAFLAGVLHAVGRLIQVPARPASQPSFDHALLGAYLLGLWGLPHPITEAVAYHREPYLLAHTEFELVDVIYVAHHIETERLGGKSPFSLDEKGIDFDYLARLGFSREQFEEFLTMAKEMDTNAF